jgi:hypothetical protein
MFKGVPTQLPSSYLFGLVSTSVLRTGDAFDVNSRLLDLQIFF